MAIEPRITQKQTIEEIQKQIDEAKPGEVVQLAPGRIRGQLVIDKPLTLRGAGADRTIIDGCRRGTTIAVDAEGGEVRIEELTVTGGRSGQGGGLSIDNGAEVHVTGCTFERNSAKSGRGGAIAVDLGAVFITECTLFENRAAVGGALFVGGQARAEIAATIIAENAAIRGGGVAVVDGGELSVWTSRIEENRAEDEGHHIYTHGTCYQRPRILLSNALLSRADAAGMAIANHVYYKADIVVDNSTLGRELLPSCIIG